MPSEQEQQQTTEEDCKIINSTFLPFILNFSIVPKDFQAAYDVSTE